MIPVSLSLFLYFSLFLLLFYVIIYFYKNYFIIIILFIYFFLEIMFRDVPGCSGMFRDVPECSMFRVLSTPLLIGLTCLFVSQRGLNLKKKKLKNTSYRIVS